MSAPPSRLQRVGPPMKTTRFDAEGSPGAGFSAVSA